MSVCLVAAASSLPLDSASFGVGQTATKGGKAAKGWDKPGWRRLGLEAPVVWQDYAWLMRAPEKSDVGQVAAPTICAPPPPAQPTAACNPCARAAAVAGGYAELVLRRGQWPH